MKKLLSALIAVGIMSFNAMPLLAMESKSCIKDIDSNYWANSAIEIVVNDGIMATDGSGLFNPETSISRAEFVTALLKVLNNDKCAITVENKYSDINKNDAFYNDILRSDSLGLVYGYPDGTFKPNKAMLRSECVSVISHITNDIAVDETIVNSFKDKKSIPAWAKNEYAKTLSYGIYVNHPDEDRLEPNRALTRAEAAVILAKLKSKIGYVKPQYIGDPVCSVPETVLGTEHLSIVEKAPNNKVQVTNLRKIVEKGNVIIVAFDEKFFSKKHQAGDIVNFVVPEALYTDEGTLLFPQGTKIVAEVTRIEKPRKFNKNARVHLLFKSVVTPDGNCYEMCGRPFTKDYTLKEGPWMTFWKLFLSTVTMGAIGAGAGTGFAFIPNPAKLGVGFAIGIPVGCSVGLVLGLLTPGLHYKAKKGEQVMVILIDELSVKGK